MRIDVIPILLYAQFHHLAWRVKIIERITIPVVYKVFTQFLNIIWKFIGNPIDFSLKAFLENYRNDKWNDVEAIL